MTPDVQRSVRWVAVSHAILAADFFLPYPTLYLYLHDVLGGDRAFQAAILASFFIIRAVFSPIVASVADRVGVRPTYAAGMLVCAAGNVAYACASSKWELLGARVVAGLGTAVDGVSFGYMAAALPPQRSAAGLANLRIAFGLGQVASPALSWLIATLTADWSAQWWCLRLSVYTVPSLVTAVFCLCYAVVVVPRISEPPKQAAPTERGKRSCRLADLPPVVVPLFGAFVITFLATTFVPVNIPLVSHQFGWGAAAASAAVTGGGAIALLSAMLVRLLIGRAGHNGVDERRLFAVCGCLCVAGGLLLTSLMNSEQPLSGKVTLLQYAAGFSLLNFFNSACIIFAGGAFRRLRHGDASNLYMSFLTTTMGLARVAAPFWGGWAHPADRAGDSDYAMLPASGLAVLGILLWAVSHRCGLLAYAGDRMGERSGLLVDVAQSRTSDRGTTGSP